MKLMGLIWKFRNKETEGMKLQVLIFIFFAHFVVFRWISTVFHQEQRCRSLQAFKFHLLELSCANWDVFRKLEH